MVVIDRGVPQPQLTTAERAVADLIIEGLSNREIAGRLGVSDRTVQSHFAHIYDKLGVRSRAEVASIVMQRQLTTLADELDPRDVSRAGRAVLAYRASGWDQLTPAEAEVAALVGRGLSNPQIGALLHVSPRTVQSHLQSIFAKVSVTTRAQLAAEVTRRDLAGRLSEIRQLADAPNRA